MAVLTASPKKPVKKQPKNNTAGYNKYKTFQGKDYTGMQVGRSHKWNYDAGVWKETKITPDLWAISYAVTKRRAGKAPEGSGVPIGTGYHWYVFAHQIVKKLNANDYTTELTGLKYKIAHKRFDKEKWSAGTKTQRKNLIRFLQNMIKQLEQEPVPIEIEYKGKVFKGEGVPIMETCTEGVCFQLDINLNEQQLGIIRKMKSGWKMDLVKDQKFVDAIGEEIMLWYE
jgi:hypothetical protein